MLVYTHTQANKHKQHPTNAHTHTLARTLAHTHTRTCTHDAHTYTQIPWVNSSIVVGKEWA